MRKQNRLLFAVALSVFGLIACDTEEAVLQAKNTDLNHKTCLVTRQNAPSNIWALGDNEYSAALMLHADKNATICVYRNDDIAPVDQARIKLAEGEFVASQTCSLRGRRSPSVFGVGVLSSNSVVSLRLAWNFDSKMQQLIVLKPSEVQCIYSEMDE